MMTVLIFIVALSVLIFVHEWGHFIVAKKSGIRVDIFSIGFGPKIFGFTWHGTEYRIAPFPFGGYVKIYGHEPMEEAEGDEEKAKEIASHPDAFASKPLYKRMAVVFAGPVMNIILCLLILPLVYMAGQYKPKIVFEKPVVVEVTHGSPAEKVGMIKGDEILKLNDKDVESWEELLTEIMIHPKEKIALTINRQGKEIILNPTLALKKEGEQSMGYLGVEYYEFFANEPVIGSVKKGTPADKAGFKAKDKIVSINGKPLQYWTDMKKILMEGNGKTVTMGVERFENQERQIVNLTVTPEYSEAHESWLIGLHKDLDKDLYKKVQYGFVESVKRGAKKFVSLFKMTLDILYRLFTFQLSFKVLGGPLQIAKIASSAAQTGLGDFLFILAFLSMQLGILNLLPIPILDGGHITFMGIEGIIRRPIPFKIKEKLMYIGLFLLLGLMIAVTINDVDNMWGISNLIGKVKGIF